MDNLGLISLTPVVVTLIVAFLKRNVFLSLLCGLGIGSLIIDIKTHTFNTGINAFINVFSSRDTVMTIFFCFLTGAIIYVAESSGGINALVEYLTEKKRFIKNRVGAQFISFIIGTLLFVDGTSSILVTSSVGKPFFDKYKIPREKLAFIVNSTGAGISFIVPFGAACAFITATLSGTLSPMNLDINVFKTVISSIPFMFYNISILIIVLITIFTGFEFKAMKDKLENYEVKKDIKEKEDTKLTKPQYAIVPIVLLLANIFTMLYITGDRNILEGDGPISLFTAATFSLIVTGGYYLYEKVCNLDEFIGWSFDGMKQLFEFLVILVLAYSFGDILGQLGTALYLAEFAAYVPNSLLLVMILFLAAIISFATGSSGGSIALLIPIVIPIVITCNIPINYAIGAIVGGSVFGDQSSPISDSIILTSSLTQVDIMDHVKTQLPYTVTALVLSSIAYMILIIF